MSQYSRIIQVSTSASLAAELTPEPALCVAVLAWLASGAVPPLEEPLFSPLAPHACAFSSPWGHKGTVRKGGGRRTFLAGLRKSESAGDLV